jgi:hypothetical protein
VHADIFDYPKQFKFNELLSHFVISRVPVSCNFRCGDWLRFLDDDYLDTLQSVLMEFGNVSDEIRQDLTLLCQLLIMHETESSAQIQSQRLISAVLVRMRTIVPLEQARRRGEKFIEQRISAVPGKPLDIHETGKGRIQTETPPQNVQDTGSA